MKYFLVGMGWLAVLAAGVEADAVGTLKGKHYVNMGSSFAAGSGIDPVRAGSVPRCRQSDANYAVLLAERLELVLDDQSCAGAHSIHLLEPWKELPPQIAAVNGDTRLVTITVGGNDLNYVGNLLAASCVEEEGLTFGDRTFPCFDETTAADAVYAQLESNLREVSTQIAAKSPEARIVFVQYLTLVPETLCDATPLSEDEAQRLRATGRRLAAITAEVATESNAVLLSTDTLSRAHSACDADPWSIGVKATSTNPDGISWHPNRRGNAVIAERLQQMLEE